MERFDLIELCAGTAAVSLLAIGAPEFPTGRMGAKAGYARAILDAIGVEPWSAKRVLLVEKDERQASILRGLLCGGAHQIIQHVRATLELEPRAAFDAAAAGSTPGDCLLELAGSFGGHRGKGFRGLDKRWKTQDGFMPNRRAIIERLTAFSRVTAAVEVWSADVSSLDPRGFAPTAVYFDPPYAGREPYVEALGELAESVARRWAAAGHTVYVSEGRPLAGSEEVVDITAAREKRQARRGLNKCLREVVSVFRGAA